MPDPSSMSPIEEQLAELIAAGLSGDDAAGKVLAPYRPSPLADFAAPAVSALAGKLERFHHRGVEDRAFGARERRERQEARLRLPQTTFRLGDGVEVEWGKATRVQHLARMAWQRGQIAGIEKDIGRHARAVELLDAHGAGCLDDIEGWADLLNGDASGLVDGDGRGGARGGGASGDGDDGPDGNQ